MSRPSARATQTAGANGDGGAIHNEGGRLALINCTLDHNSAFKKGGAIRNSNGNISLDHCLLGQNVAGTGGGGLSNDVGSATLTNCAITQNTAKACRRPAERQQGDRDGQGACGQGAHDASTVVMPNS